ncbi:MAG: NYN domain-containing protein [Candidatus Omnitrophica bacterium]|nr:NYN domain-containing protein [Candidatus Omnitrophota bacterium]
MKTIILDGYNVIHKIPELSRKLDESLAAARTALAIHMSSWRRKYLYQRIHIVFDGQDRATWSYSQTALHGIGCSFTQTKDEADDYIIRIIRKSKNPHDITVISDDNKIRNNCKAYGVKVESPSFLNKSREKSRGTKEAAKTINTKDNKEITDYYEAHLKEKGKI